MFNAGDKMRIILKLFFLRAILGIAIFIASPMAAQHRILNTSEVNRIEKELSDLSPGIDKVNLLLNVSYYYYNTTITKFWDLNKASKFANQALNDSKSIGYKRGVGESYLQLSMIDQQAKNYYKGKIYATKAVNIFKQLNKPDLLGEAWVMLWSTSTLVGESHEKRVNLLKTAAEAFHLSGNFLREGDCLGELADILQINGNYGEAIIQLDRQLILYKKAGKKELYDLYDLTGRIYLMMGSIDKALDNILKAEKLADELGASTLFLSTLNNSLAMAYTKIGQPEKGLPYIEKALGLAIKVNDLNRIVLILSNNVNILMRLKRTKQAIILINKMRIKYPQLKSQKDPILEAMLVDIYISRGELGNALNYCNIIEQRIKTFHTELDKDYIFHYYGSIVRYNLLAGNYDKASEYNKKYDSICIPSKRMFYCDYYLWEFKIDSAKGNYIAAIKNLQRYKQINDEIFSQAKTKQINELSILHESEKKDKNIQLLKQRAVVQESRVDSANFIRNTSLAGFLLLMIFIFFMYKNYIQKQKTNIALSAQKEEIKIKNDELQCLVTEKEWLLKEIHHRVKNNLHMVIGLLASQGEYLKSKEAAQAMGESQRRVEAMSIIHQKLYQSENLSMIDMPSYIYELTENLADSFEKGRHIRFQLDIANVMFPLSHSVPVGLIVNEAVTNAIKYAFPNEGDCSIEIVLKKEENNSFFMKISDNGIGIGKDFSIEKCSSLGLRLMQGLTGDIQGDFQIRDNNGTEIILRFTIHEDMASNLKLLKV